ncbi:DUF362 domain-containing protein [Alkaliphilus peptidifermentans]|uniref:Uncharacterized conserved protein, DUF362 family n=1 Tax=Alkaliphilus peptidifermentans DSM 18978 TaxID=1120976 RepID=A0A1G5I4K6_9FIRM|nr:DUF362 domain-containing protein [Alkaliphilus peptidifermentans]SCY70834.1 Uncharacterized conserved protein, DUF362 family [Alkaliphilus peptidifermentans DSM 18978]
METVYIEKCDGYNYRVVEKAVFKCLEKIQPLNDRMKDKTILVKVNLLKKNKPEDAVTTHPFVVEAIVRYLQGIQCKVIIGDSPGGPYNKKMLDGVYKESQMDQVAYRTGCQLNYDTSVIEVYNGKATKLKRMQIIKVAEDVDYVISAAKLKTHSMMTFTGAVKNLFGVIPGVTKTEYHFKMNNPENFAHHLIDICQYINPVISIIDAVEGMEGDGPAAGDKRHVGLIMASTSPYALDTAAAHVIGIEPLSVPTINIANERGIFCGSIKGLIAKGIGFDDIDIEPFKLPQSINVNFFSDKTPKFIKSFFINNLRAKPVFDHKLCTSCGICKEGCPVAIIDMDKGKPTLDISKCICCFCCNELCPQKAVKIKKSFLHRLLMD